MACASACDNGCTKDHDTTPLLGSTERSSFTPAYGSTASKLENVVISRNRKSTTVYSKISMKRTVGFGEGTAIVMGIIVGSGIFISPAGVAVNSGSVGVSLMVWTVCGVLSALGALSFAELGTTIPKSGGDYLYILEVFGPFWAFMRLWIELVVIRPGGHAIVSLTLASYLVKFNCAQIPPAGMQLIALVSIGLLVWLNCKSSRWAARVQNVFTAAKVAALCIIIVMGIAQAAQGKVDNLKPSNIFDGSSTDVGNLVLAMNAGLWAFAGWNELNYITDEIKNPARNLPLAILTSMVLITVLYVLINLAYFTALTPLQMAESEATAVTFGNLTMGKWSLCIPVFVSLCCIGGINGSLYTSSRLFYVGACEGHLPSIMAMVSVRNLTPVPSIIVIGLLSAVYMVTDDVFVLITYVNFVYYLAMAFAIVGLIVLRIKCPDMERPLKLPLIIPIVAALLCFATGVLSFVEAPVESAIGVAMVLTSVPVYLIFVRARKHEKLLQFNEYVTSFLQCMTEAVPEESKQE